MNEEGWCDGAGHGTAGRRAWPCIAQGHTLSLTHTHTHRQPHVFALTPVSFIKTSDTWPPPQGGSHCLGAFRCNCLEQNSQQDTPSDLYVATWQFDESLFRVHLELKRLISWGYHLAIFEPDPAAFTTHLRDGKE